jgi:predicted SprT family Zn-dependent metalloprotease
VTAYPGARPGDLLETLLHELTHLAVGRSPGKHAWHGREFRLTLRAAMAEAYGVSIAPRHSRHGAYANAIEARLAPARAA